MLSSYGPETKETRDLIRQTVASRVNAIWPKDRSQRASLDAPEAAFTAQEIEARMVRLSPQNNPQRWLQTQALRSGRDNMETRWLVLGSLGSSIPVPFLVIVVFRLTIIFASFGLFAPGNTTVVVVLFLCALSVAGSIFLILEMNRPFEGMMKNLQRSGTSFAFASRSVDD